jgi:hypothetical protein
MQEVKTVKGQHLKSLITGAAEKHAAIHNGVRHHAQNSHERRLARHEEMEANLKLTQGSKKGAQT